MKSFPAGNEISDQRQENQKQRGNIHLCDAHGTSRVYKPVVFPHRSFFPRSQNQASFSSLHWKLKKDGIRNYRVRRSAGEQHLVATPKHFIATPASVFIFKALKLL